jgi:hypothetical protein
LEVIEVILNQRDEVAKGDLYENSRNASHELLKVTERFAAA